MITFNKKITFSLLLQKFRSFCTEKFAIGSWDNVISFPSKSFSLTLINSLREQVEVPSRTASMMRQGASSRKMAETSTWLYSGGGIIRLKSFDILLYKNLLNRLQSSWEALAVLASKLWVTTEKVSWRHFSEIYSRKLWILIIIQN